MSAISQLFAGLMPSQLPWPILNSSRRITTDIGQEGHEVPAKQTRLVIFSGAFGIEADPDGAADLVRRWIDEPQ